MRDGSAAATCGRPNKRRGRPAPSTRSYYVPCSVAAGSPQGAPYCGLPTSLHGCGTVGATQGGAEAPPNAAAQRHPQGAHLWLRDVIILLPSHPPEESVHRRQQLVAGSDGLGLPPARQEGCARGGAVGGSAWAQAGSRPIWGRFCRAGEQSTLAGAANFGMTRAGDRQREPGGKIAWARTTRQRGSPPSLFAGAQARCACFTRGGSSSARQHNSNSSNSSNNNSCRRHPPPAITSRTVD